MKYGVLTNHIRNLRGFNFDIDDAMQASGATYTQAHGIIHKLKSRGQIRLVRKGDIGRFAKAKSRWKIV